MFYGEKPTLLRFVEMREHMLRFATRMHWVDLISCEIKTHCALVSAGWLVMLFCFVSVMVVRSTWHSGWAEAGDTTLRLNCSQLTDWQWLGCHFEYVALGTVGLLRGKGDGINWKRVWVGQLTGPGGLELLWSGWVNYFIHVDCVSWFKHAERCNVEREGEKHREDTVCHLLMMAIPGIKTSSSCGSKCIPIVYNKGKQISYAAIWCHPECN